MKGKTISFIAMLSLVGLAALASVATAQTEDADLRKVVIQVSTDDEATQNTAMSNVKNVLKLYGDNVRVVLVAYGSGLSILDETSPQAEKIADLTARGAQFDACNNTITKWTNQGHPPTLLPDVVVVDSGVGRIIELQREGYTYVRP
jgi:intracellular sulfur oxidation DsrE/DsrF family protein